jgi:hypothetical protein
MNPIILLVFAGVALAVTTFAGKANGSTTKGPGTRMADIMLISGPNIR